MPTPRETSSTPAAVLLVTVALVSFACNGVAGTASPPTAPATPATATPGAAASPTVATSPSATPVVSPTPVGSPSGSESGDVAVDLSLLAHLPTTVDGLSVEADPEAAKTIAASPKLGPDASAIAVARVVDPASGDLAVATIVRLRSGPFDDASFDTWRTLYDEAACEPAGGVAATSERQVGGRQVFVAACNGGAQTFHVALGDDFIVSITAIGERHLGDLLVAGLRE
jgi:hypothetical protein